MTTSKPDRLSALIAQFRVETTVLPVGIYKIPKRGNVEKQPNLFIFAEGCLQIFDQCVSDINGTSPILVYFPRGMPAGLSIKNDARYASFVCASVNTGGNFNPISLALPDIVAVPLNDAESLKAVADILFEEASLQRCGGHAVIDRLCEIVVIQLLRHVIEQGDAKVGLIAGLAHPNLSLAIVAMHDAPQKKWHLEDLASIAGMSRTHFSNTFRKIVGVTAGNYLSSWRLTLARMELSKGTLLKTVVRQVGFSSSAALSRAFKRRYGITPKQDTAF